MEKFICRICNSGFFEINEVVKHLKYTHHFKDNKQQIPCVVNFKNNSFCPSTFLTFSGLRNHIKSCKSTLENTNVSDDNNSNVFESQSTSNLPENGEISELTSNFDRILDLVQIEQ